MLMLWPQASLLAFVRSLTQPAASLGGLYARIRFQHFSVRESDRPDDGYTTVKITFPS
jgi:hypothetical protein